MKVLHVTRDFPPRVNGGLSNAVGGMARAAQRAGLAQAVVSFDGYRPRGRPGEQSVASGENERGLPVLRLSGPGQLPDALRFAQRFGADVVHVHQAMLWDFACEAAAGVPRVFSVHLPQALLRALRGPSEPTRSELDQARALAEAALVTVPSEACRAALPAAHRASAALLPLGVDDSEEARRAVDRPRPPATFLYVGRFGDVKGTQQLLDAIPAVEAALPRTRFVLAGGLPDNPKADRRWRRRFAERAPRADLRGWCSAAELSELFAGSTLLVAPSWFETFGLAVLEAMLHGLPVVASDAGALAEIVEPQRTGWLVPPRDVEALVAGLVAAAGSGRAAEMGQQAAARVRARWLWPARVEHLLALYRRLRDG